MTAKEKKALQAAIVAAEDKMDWLSIQIREVRKAQLADLIKLATVKEEGK